MTTSDIKPGMFPDVPKSVLLIAATACVLLMLVAAWWVLSPRHVMLFQNLDATAATEVAAVLNELGVPYKYDEKGAQLLVPADQVLSTRMELSSRGIPKKGSVGFELFTDADYGMTDFAQKVNFQRALQGELERTISSLQEVRSARVHLTLARASAFFRERESPKASVTIATVGNVPLSAAQITGIQNLVSAAVESLEPETVVILDHRGLPMSGAAESAVSGLGSSRGDEQRRLEDELQEKIHALLKDALGVDNFAVSVTAELNFDRVRQTREEMLPQGHDGNGLVLRKKENRQNVAKNAGANGGAGNSTSEIQYALGKSTEEIVYAPGRIERLAVGVLVNRDVSETARQRMQELIAAAIGIDESRGDRVVVTSFASEFNAVPTPAEAAAVPEPANAVAAVATSANNETRPNNLSIAGLDATFLLLVSVVAGLLVALVVMVAVRRRPQSPSRMNENERRDALREIQTWLNNPETMERS